MEEPEFIEKQKIKRAKESLRIIESIKADRFNIRDHAGRRGDERALTRQNVISIIETLILTKYQENKFTHLFIGFLNEKQTGGFTAVINEGVWIVTIFKRRLTRIEKELLDKKK